MIEWLRELSYKFDDTRDLEWYGTMLLEHFIDWLEETGAFPWHPISDMPPEGASALLLDRETPWADVDWEFHKEGLDPSITHWQLLELPQEVA